MDFSMLVIVLMVIPLCAALVMALMPSKVLLWSMKQFIFWQFLR